jgi:hypothetical protein
MLEPCRYIAFSTVHGLSLGYGPTAREARDSAVEMLQLKSDALILTLDCGQEAPEIWLSMRLLGDVIATCPVALSPRLCTAR